MVLPLAAIVALAGPVLVLDQATTRAAGDASLLADLGVCPFSVGLSIVREVAVPGVIVGDASSTALTLDQVSAAIDHVVGASASDHVITVFGATVSMSDPTTGKEVPVQLVSRTDASDHVVPKQTSPVDGLLVQTTSMVQLGVTDPIAVDLVDDAQSVSSRISAVVTPLSSGVDPSYWCSLNPQIYGSDGVNETPFAIVDQSTLLDIMAKLHQPTVFAAWEYPPSADDWTLTTASHTLARYAAIAKDAANPDGDVETKIGDGPPPRSDQINTLSTARQQMLAAHGAVRPFTSGTLVVLLIALLVAASSWLYVGRSSRRAMVRHGVGVGGITLKNVLELAPPVVIGIIAGDVGSWFVVRHELPEEARSWLTGINTSDRLLVAVVVPLALVALVALFDAVQVVRPRQQQRVWLFPAGVLAAIVAAVFSIYTYRQRVSNSRLHNSLLGSDLLASTAAVFVVAVISIVVTRLTVSARTMGLADRLPASVWLAWRRLGSDRSIRYTLACVSIALAMVYLATANLSSITESAETRRTTQIGAETVYVLNEQPTPAMLTTLPSAVTIVTKLPESSVLATGKSPLVVLGVDPSTFAQQAFWRANFSDESLASLLAKLDDPSDPFAAIVVGDDVPDRFQATLPTATANVAVHLHTVDHARYFPGKDTIGHRSLVVVNRTTLLDAGIVGGTQLWTSSSTVVPLETLRLNGFSTVRIDQAADQPLNGVPATITALHHARRITLLALAGAVMAGWAWLVSRHSKDARERHLLRVLGVSRRAVVKSAATESLIAGVLIIVTALVAGETANRVLPAFADQSPFLKPPTERTFDALPWILAGAATLLVLVVTAGLSSWRLGRTNAYSELVRDA